VLPSVFHVRLKTFELQAERLLDAALRTRPVAIISSHKPNGTVVALSSEAQEEGLYRGMHVSLARRMSHGVLLLPYNRSLYSRLHRFLYKIMASFTPLVEPGGYGQFFLDMSGMETIYRDWRAAGFSLARTIQAKTDLKGAVGISVNKLVSRLATAVGSDTIQEIRAGEEIPFLAPLATPLLPTVRRPPVKKVVEFLCLERVGHLQQVVSRPDDTAVLFGAYARQLTREARGQDTAAVRPPRLRDRLLEQVVLPHDTNDQDTLRAVVQLLAEQLAFKLRQRQQIARRVCLEIHYTDGFRSVRRGTLRRLDDRAVTEVCWRLYETANYRRQRLRTIQVEAADFRPYAYQLEAFTTEDARNLALSCAVEAVRRKHGIQALRTANVVRALGAAMGSASGRALSQTSGRA